MILHWEIRAAAEVRNKCFNVHNIAVLDFLEIMYDSGKS